MIDKGLGMPDRFSTKHEILQLCVYGIISLEITID